MCVCVCVCVCVSVQAITFEPLHIETSFMVCRYMFTITKSSLSIKVIGQGQGHMTKMLILLLLTCYFSVCGYRPLIRSRSHIKVKVTSRSK